MKYLEEIEDKQALLTYLETFLTDSRKKRFEEVLNNRTRHFAVAVEDVYKDRNASAIIRTADCFGIQDVHIIENHNEYKLSSEIAVGSDKWINATIYDKGDYNSKTCIKALRSQGYQIIATTPHKDDHLLENFDIAPKTAIFFGGEKDGLSNQVIKEADGFLKIPIVGFSESFNISVAAAIILYSLREKLKKSRIDWQITEKERFDLKLDWTIKTIQNVQYLIRRFLDERGDKNIR